MAFISSDKRAILGAGGYSICLECDEPTPDRGVSRHEHAPHCSQAPKPAPVRAAPRRTTDPNVYVMTDKGFERAIDVERRREAKRNGR